MSNPGIQIKLVHQLGEHLFHCLEDEVPNLFQCLLA
jgi:hypothetical protein